MRCFRCCCGSAQPKIIPEDLIRTFSGIFSPDDHIWALEVEDYWQAVSRLTLTTRGGKVHKTQQLVSDQYANRFQKALQGCSKRTRLEKNEYWVGLNGYFDWQENERVLMVETLLLAKYDNGQLVSTRLESPCSSAEGYPTGRATKVKWELPQGYAATGLRCVPGQQGSMVVQGLLFAPIPMAKPSRRSRFRLLLLRILGANDDLLSKDKMFFVDILWNNGAAYYVDAVLDIMSTLTFISGGFEHFAQISMMAILASSVSSWISCATYYAALEQSEAIWLFGYHEQPGRIRIVLILLLVLIAHIFQLHVIFLVYVSLRLGQKHQLLGDAKQSESMIEAPLTTLIQCYTIAAYSSDGEFKLVLSMLSGILSIGYGLAGYDAITTGMDGLPGKLKMGKRFFVIFVLRAAEAAFRITSLVLFQSLNKPYGGFIVFGIGFAAQGIMLACSGSMKSDLFGTLKNMCVSAWFSRNPMMEQAAVSGVPYSWRFCYRLVELLAMILWLLIMVDSSDITASLEANWFMYVVCVLGSSIFFCLVPFVRCKWTTFAFEELLELSANEKKLDLKAQLGASDVQGPGYAIGNALAGFLKEQRQVDRFKNVQQITIEGGNADGPYLIPTLCKYRSPSVEVLNFKKCGLSGDSVVPLLKCIAGSNIKNLNLYWNPAIGDIGAKAIAAYLVTDTALTHLNLEWAGMTDEGAVPLFEALAQNTTLEEITLKWIEGFLDPTGEALLKCLEANKKLKMVRLQIDGMSNQIQDKLFVHSRVSS